MPIFGNTFILRALGVMFALVLAAVLLYSFVWLVFTVTRVWYDHMEKTNSEFWQWLKTKIPKRRKRRKVKPRV